MPSTPSTAMAIYAIAVIPLILMLVEATSKHQQTISAGYADDLTVAGMIRRLKIWWDKLWELDLDKVLSKITKIEAQSAYNKLHIHASFQA